MLKFTAALLFYFVITTTVNCQENRPNIILILADDLGEPLFTILAVARLLLFTISAAASALLFTISAAARALFLPSSELLRALL
jgi:hypothetical protein